MRAAVPLPLVLALASAPAAAQAPAPPAAQPAPQAAAAPPPASAFTYDPEGRRDPFVSLLGRGAEGRSTANRPAGLSGVLIDEVVVKGIVKGTNGYYALVTGSEPRVLTLRTGDRLMDGTVKTITATEVVFAQDVNDPLSLQKTREIRKSLRPGEENRG